MRLTLSVILIVLLYASSSSDGATAKPKSYKILCFLPMPSKSHHKVFEPILKELALRGHQVTVVTPLPKHEQIPNYKEIVIKNYQTEIEETMMKDAGTNDQREILKMGMFLTQVIVFMMRYMGVLLGNHIFKDPTVQQLLASNEKYDALFVEAAFMQEMNIALAHKFDAVTIEVLTAANSHWAYWLYGNPYDTSYITELSVPYTDHMSFLERLHNTVLSLTIRGFYGLYYMPVYQDIMDQLIRYPGWEKRPPLMDMLHNVSLVLVNTHFSINYPYPMAPHFKEIGGINIVPEKKLSKELQDFMDGAKDGVIYFSLGSNFNASRVTGEDDLKGLVRLFGRIKQRVLWKFDKPNIPDLTSNVKLSPWLPQQDILAHKNCKAFITHGGFLSVTESLYYGVPMIGTPILGDQLKNVRHMELHGYGIGLDFFNVSESSMDWALREIFNNPKYRQNAIKQSQLFRDKPETALETAVYWTEYVIRHKGAHHLRPAIATMPWYQQAMLDVYAAIALMIVIPIIITYLVIKMLFKFLCYLCCSSSSSKDKKSKRKKE